MRVWGETYISKHFVLRPGILTFFNHESEEVPAGLFPMDFPAAVLGLPLANVLSQNASNFSIGIDIVPIGFER